MNPKAVSAEELGLETRKVLARARKGPVIVKEDGHAPLVLRPLVDDDLADELISLHSEFKASIRKARKNFARGKGIPLSEARRRLKA